MEKMISIMKIRWSKDSIIKGKWRMKDKKMDERRKNIYLIYELQRWSSSSNSSWTHVEAGEDVGAEQLHWTLMMINWMHLWTAHESVKCFLFNQIVCFKFTFIHWFYWSESELNPHDRRCRYEKKRKKKFLNYVVI